jgi:hypothetical protein
MPWDVSVDDGFFILGLRLLREIRERRYFYVAGRIGPGRFRKSLSAGLTKCGLLQAIS